MLFAHNGGGLRLAVVGVVGIFLLACSNETTPGPSPVPSKQPQAADLRTHLDLLLGEQVMIVAKETAAAINHSDQYSGYTALLSTNNADLSALMGRAFGNTTAGQFSDAWSMQNGYLVDYAIGVVTHNDGKAKDALTGLTNTFVPQFAQLISDTSHLPLDPVTQLMTQQVLEDKAFIDDAGALKYSTFYKDLHKAYAQSFRFGDALAVQIAARFPDKFPGDPSLRTVDTRVALNTLLQEHSYLVTMATDAIVATRTDESTAASAALVDNGSALAVALSNTELTAVWTVKNNALFGYASGKVQDNPLVTGKFVGDFVAVTHADKAAVQAQLKATLKVIDDQRAKIANSIAGDDRAAATSMQPIADSIQG
jgi:hypothetical protein